MINKKELGEKIKKLRQKQGLSRDEMSNLTNISVQAVSKWETGKSIPDIEILLILSHIFNTTINKLLESEDLIGSIVNRNFVKKEIYYFIPQEEKDYNKTWAKEIIERNWVKKNWEKQKEQQIFKPIADKIIGHGGIILELGAGPGGGYMPAVLSGDKNVRLIISDLSPTVVLEWKKLLDREISPPNTFYAALDNCDLPFKDNSIDVVSIGGFGNTEGDKYKAVREIYRVLKHGGLFVSGDGYVTNKTLKSYPEEIQKTLMEKRPDIFEDFYDAAVTAGFRQIDNQIFGGWTTENDESAIADLARELGIIISFASYLRYCVK